MDLSEEQQRKNSGWANLKPYPPGVSGNPGGRPKGSRSIRAIMRRRLDEGEDGDNIAEDLAETALKRAKAGDLGFWKEAVDGTEGKVPDKIEGAIIHTIKKVILEDGNGDTDTGIPGAGSGD